jgi:hypothetical protein
MTRARALCPGWHPEEAVERLLQQVFSGFCTALFSLCHFL